MKQMNRTQNLRYAIIVGIVISVIGGASYSAGQKGHDLNFRELRAAFDSYLDFPSEENARAILAILPREKPNKITGDFGEVLHYVVSAKNYGILADEAQAGSRYTTEILCRLLNFADGMAAEYISATLGTLLRFSPKLFIEVLFDYKDTELVKRIVHSAASTDYAYNVHPKACIFDFKKRIEALEGITDPRFADVKKACIQELLEKIKWLESEK